jgi:3-deoxy-D-manno-octulosonate 8-phosphate phosphatase (KDO 8-P phosphatase)
MESVGKKGKPKPRKSQLVKSLAQIKLVIFDIDGVMTDGKIFWSENLGWGAFYSVIDGFGIRLLMKAGIKVAVISGGNFVSHKERAKVLGIQDAYFGNEDKTPAYEELKKKFSVGDKECAYIADELFDLPLLEKVGFAVCPPHAPPPLRKVAHYITKSPGGGGCVRELADLILEARSPLSKRGVKR